MEKTCDSKTGFLDLPMYFLIDSSDYLCISRFSVQFFILVKTVIFLIRVLIFITYPFFIFIMITYNDTFLLVEKLLEEGKREREI